MGELAFRNITKRFDKTEVLRHIDFQIEDGEFVVIVGPSGCGKSTLLRIAAGLEDQSEGQVIIGGTDVSLAPPAKRAIAMVFQSYALYPPLTVEGNMSLGLKQARTPKTVIKERIAEATRILALEPYLKRKPGQLSGGQRQRVAIGRAISRHPQVFLFDEPLSNLDAALRDQVRMEIADLHRRLGATMLYVTHDQVEAMTLADRIVVMHDGVIQQIGTPRDLYQSPANTFVAGFIGSPRMNMFDARLQDGMIHAPGLPPIAAPADKALPDRVTVGLRANGLGLRPAAMDGPETPQVIDIDYLGNLSYLRISLPENATMVVEQRPDHPFAVGDGVTISVAADDVHLFNPEGHRI
ncbi:MAG: ABC transporter ATP-binding protein [Rhodobacteraceae bacterium]|nr:ABC transporter ATP-binding protein [Paracoccaceae bacterium]